MSVLLAINLVMFAQDDTGAAPRWAILLGALAFPCLVVASIIWQKLKNAKANEKHIERLQNKVAELEQTSAPRDMQTRYGLSLRDAQDKSQQLKHEMTQDEVISLLGKPDEISAELLGTGTPNPWNGIVWHYRWGIDSDGLPQQELTIFFESDSHGCILNNWYFNP